VEVAPAPGTTIDVGQSTVTVWFHTPVNAPTLAFSLIGQGAGPQSFTIPVGLGANPVVLNLSAPLAPDTYTLTITGAVVASNSGMALDGEVSSPTDPNALPSGDGLPGGSATLEFTVVCIGDVDTNDEINLADFAALQRGFGTTNAQPADGDLDGDHDVDLTDHAALVPKLGSNCN
jgi:hypothetical protein